MKPSHSFIFVLFIMLSLFIFWQMLREINRAGETVSRYLSNIEARLDILEHSVDAQDKALRDYGLSAYPQDPKVP